MRSAGRTPARATRASRFASMASISSGRVSSSENNCARAHPSSRRGAPSAASGRGRVAPLPPRPTATGEQSHQAANNRDCATRPRTILKLNWRRARSALMKSSSCLLRRTPAGPGAAPASHLAALFPQANCSPSICVISIPALGRPLIVAGRQGERATVRSARGLIKLVITHKPGRTGEAAGARPRKSGRPAQCRCDLLPAIGRDHHLSGRARHRAAGAHEASAFMATGGSFCLVRGRFGSGDRRTRCDNEETSWRSMNNALVERHLRPTSALLLLGLPEFARHQVRPSVTRCQQPPSHTRRARRP